MPEKYKLIIMYEPYPNKKGKNRPFVRALELDLRKVTRKYGYKWIGQEYDFTNKRWDIEYWKEIK
ncbi:MAG: hypothetical protein KKD77_20795 [Gammaproteobacteria bacterium]|nr:hypothetical protein [Gammaproteobacteria bacterium]